jgi:two-component system heavy metal sensor histidine kinase CusS
VKRARLIAAIAALTLVALGVSFWGVAALFNREQERQLDRALLTMAAQAADRAVMPTGEILIVDGPGPAVNDSGPLPLYGAIYDEQGTPRATTSTFAGEAPLTAALHANGEPFDLALGHNPGDVHRPGWACPLRLRAVMVAVPGLPRGSLLLATPRSDIDGDAVMLGRALATVFAVACGWSVLVVLWLMRRLVRDHHGAMEHLGAELESHKRFLAMAAHELRAPLTLVHGQLALALRRPRNEAEYRSAIGEALSAASHLRALTEDLLDLERARACRNRPAVPTSIARVTRSAARFVEGDAARRAVTLDLRGHRGFVLGRAGDLERLVRNLLENAVRHSPPGGRVIVEAACAGGCIELSVSDEGDGVSEADRGQLFEPFFRASSADTPGAGLGLAIAREIARAHGGDIQLDPTRTRGARFVVRLPAVARPEEREAAATVSVAA